MTGNEKVLIRRNTVNTVIALILVDAFLTKCSFQYGGNTMPGVVFLVLTAGVIPFVVLSFLLIPTLRKKETCACCGEKFDNSYSFCPYCGAPKIRAMSEDQKLHKYVEDGIDRFKYSTIRDDSDADRRFIDNEPGNEDADDNIDIKRAEAVIEDQLKSNQDFVESLGE